MRLQAECQTGTTQVSSNSLSLGRRLRVAQNHPVPCNENLTRDCDLALVHT
ncbi:hypothetical protein DPMN_037249 [Dreissena polymorpha]|uniref:Uncharacterized protein n=1 Tax=Dreissena polymorpha TaxID=45954 RepID=A0A9D4MCA9_DREPO|nr:hypothetical protein DPMN_037249 [Dreissena polymorpha]